MATLIVLPPGPEPQRETARYTPKNLKEQLMAFLNSNNRRGFAEEEEPEYVPPDLEYAPDARAIVEILFDLAAYRYITVEYLRKFARELKKSSGKRPISGRHGNYVAWTEGVSKYGIKQSYANEIVAIVLGYNRYKEALDSQTTISAAKNPVIFNKRAPGEFKAEFFPDISQEAPNASKETQPTPRSSDM